MGNTIETQNLSTVQTKQRRIAELAQANSELVFVSLHHYLDDAWMLEAYRRTRKDGAVGIDGVTAVEYEQNLTENLKLLLDLMKSGSYRPPAVRRVYIPKADGSRRPLGIPTLEDKVAQRAIVMLLEPIYEQTFLDCSYGFRPGRSAHQALDAISANVVMKRQEWIIDIDIKNYFGSIQHQELRLALDKRIRDGVVRRLIDKWLRAGIFEAGKVIATTEGTPQGGVASPILANIFLHYVVDRWFQQEVLPRMKGSCSLIRYADDMLMMFQHSDDCQRVYRVLGKRLARYGLTLHPEKTHIVDFTVDRGNIIQRKERLHQSGSFNFLGFTHVRKRSRRGKWIVLRRTAKDRLRRALNNINNFCRDYRTLPIDKQYQSLSRKLLGHYAYYGVTGNTPQLKVFLHTTKRIWYKWLRRRSGERSLTWDAFYLLLNRFKLPTTRIFHAAVW